MGLTVADRKLVNKLDLIVRSGERIGIIGRNGTGKTTFLRSILNEITPSEGQIVLGSNTVPSYFDQQREGLDPSASIFDNVGGGKGRIDVGGQSLEVRAYLERFLFDSYKQRQPVSSLSGGERARVALAKMLSQAANLILLDEPTNDLDVATLGSLEQMLVEFEGSAIIVTHDRWFLNRVATSILAFEGNGRVIRYAGNYDSYQEQRAASEEERARAARALDEARDKAAKGAGAPSPSGRSERTSSKAAGLSFAEQKELDGILDRIEDAEQAVSRLEATLADPTFYATRAQEAADVARKLDEARAEAKRLTERWEELETKRTKARS